MSQSWSQQPVPRHAPNTLPGVEPQMLAAEYRIAQHPDYRGVVRMTAEEFAQLVHAGAEAGWSVTTHYAGGGEVDLILNDVVPDR